MAYRTRRSGRRKKRVAVSLFRKLPTWAKKAVSRAAGKKRKTKRKSRRFKSNGLMGSSAYYEKRSRARRRLAKADSFFGY